MAFKQYSLDPLDVLGLVVMVREKLGKYGVGLLIFCVVSESSTSFVFLLFVSFCSSSM